MPASIAVCTTAMTSPASAPNIVKPRMRSPSAATNAFIKPRVSEVVRVRNTAAIGILANNAFVLFSGSDDKTRLIVMEGNEVHRWDHRGFPSGMLDPALVGGVRGHVMVQLADMTGSETGMIPGYRLY